MTDLYAIRDLRLSLPDMTKKPLLGPAPRIEILKGLTFSIPKGEILGIVGGSGSGKSTLGRALVRLLEPTGGSVAFDGIDITHLTENSLRPLRRRFQMIFQDPMSSLNPRHRVGQIIAAPLSLHGLDSPTARALEALDHVGLPRHFATRFAHELSGGQRQRVGIARAICRNAPIMLLDEATSALDSGTEQKVMEGLLGAYAANKTMIIVAHRISTLKDTNRVLVFERGEIVEEGSFSQLSRDQNTRFGKMYAIQVA